MRLLLAVALLAGCADSADHEIQASVAQSDLVDAAPPPRECDGSNTRHICNAYPATATAMYGLLPTCMGTPFLPTDGDGGVALRPEGQAGCVNVGFPRFGGPAYARCCP